VFGLNSLWVAGGAFVERVWTVRRVRVDGRAPAPHASGTAAERRLFAVPVNTANRHNRPMTPHRHGWRDHLPAVVIGVGLGGFFDGIVLHQLLQWHHLASNVVPADTLEGLEANTFLDGAFHQAMWIVTVVGVALLYARLADPDRARRAPLLAGALVGFGGFNVADSVLFHWLLGLHNIRPGPDTLLYDAGFFAWGVAMVLAGLLLARRAARAAHPGGLIES
jgi:uncharacterized membrane protein